MTLDVEAANWMLALRSGLDEIGADRDLVKRATCEIKPDKTIRVVEPEQGRVFVLRELPEPSTTSQSGAVSEAAVPPPGAPPAMSDAPVENWRSPSSPRRTISHLHLSRIGRDFNAPNRSAGHVEEDKPPLADASTDSDDQDLLTELFEGLADVSDASESIEETLQHGLELLMDKIPSMAGWLLLFDINRHDLYVAMASGPKAEQVIRYRLPLGRGIAGFCAANGVSLTLGNVERDSRFKMSLSRSVGLEVASVACAPIKHAGRVYGALQLVNHLSNAEFSPREQAALNYAAGRMGEYLVNYAVVEPIS